MALAGDTFLLWDGNIVSTTRNLTTLAQMSEYGAAARSDVIPQGHTALSLLETGFSHQMVLAYRRFFFFIFSLNVWKDQKGDLKSAFRGVWLCSGFDVKGVLLSFVLKRLMPAAQPTAAPSTQKRSIFTHMSRIGFSRYSRYASRMTLSARLRLGTYIHNSSIS
jgi:hypothetical protein